MQVPRKQMKTALSILEEHEPEKTKKLQKALKKICKGMQCHKADLTDCNVYIAPLLRQESDIARDLKQSGIEASQENIDKVICELDLIELKGSYRHVWYEAVSDAVGRAFPMREE